MLRLYNPSVSRRGFLSGTIGAAGAAWGVARPLWAWQQQDNAQFSTGVNVVNVLVSVHDKEGQTVKGLTANDFKLDEDGHPQTIRYFAQQFDLPLTLGLLIDTSGSQRRVLDQERRASYQFFEHVLREDKDKAFVIHFDREVELLQDLTSSRKDLEDALKDVDSERPQLNRRSQGSSYPDPQGGGYPPQGRGRGAGGTALYDAVLLASDELMKKQQGRKSLILLSDGVDNGSKVSLSSAIESAQRANTSVYSIRFADEDAYSQFQNSPFGGFGGGRRGGMGRSRMPPVQSHPDGKKILQQISRETGGEYFDVTKKMPLEMIYDRIEQDLRNQYNLGYTSDQTSNSYYRKIHVTTTQKNVTVQARDGYYPADSKQP